MHEFAVFIGRFQPFHNAHLASLRFALAQAERVIVVLGSDNRARTVKDPWTTGERIEMIESTMTPEELNRISYVGAKDYLYNENLWIAEVQRAVSLFTDESKDVVLIGHRKDHTSFYLNLFPQWKFIETDLVAHSCGATKIRQLMFTQDKIGIRGCVPAPVYNSLVSFMDDSREFTRLLDEYRHIQDYRSQWDDAPFPPTFVTTDAVVFCSGHVLVVRRKGALGRGLIALPGGFLNTNERIVDGCLRELREETGLADHLTRKNIVDERVFDHPTRSLRGRTITHVSCINLGRGPLPEVKGSDDASDAWWMPIDELHWREDEFFEDHHSIITYFAHRV